MNQEPELLSCCGYDCSQCPVYQATLSDDPVELRRCTGCRAEGVKLPYCEDGCAIRSSVLAQEKKRR